MCDNIYVMKEGRVLESGTHQQLMESGNDYANVVNTYYRIPHGELASTLYAHLLITIIIIIIISPLSSFFVVFLSLMTICGVSGVVAVASNIYILIRTSTFGDNFVQALPICKTFSLLRSRSCMLALCGIAEFFLLV